MVAEISMSHARVEVFQCLTGQCDNPRDRGRSVSAALHATLVVGELRHRNSERCGGGCLGVSQASAPGLQVGSGSSVACDVAVEIVDGCSSL